jgi:hypothetical protein
MASHDSCRRPRSGYVLTTYLTAEAVMPLPIACATMFHVAVDGFISAAEMASMSMWRSSSGVQIVPLPPLAGIFNET